MTGRLVKIALVVMLAGCTDFDIMRDTRVATQLTQICALDICRELG